MKENIQKQNGLGGAQISNDKENTNSGYLEPFFSQWRQISKKFRSISEEEKREIEIGNKNLDGLYAALREAFDETDVIMWWDEHFRPSCLIKYLEYMFRDEWRHYEVYEYRIRGKAVYIKNAPDKPFQKFILAVKGAKWCEDGTWVDKNGNKHELDDFEERNNK